MRLERPFRYRPLGLRTRHQTVKDEVEMVDRRPASKMLVEACRSTMQGH